MNLHLSTTQNHFIDYYDESNIAEIETAFGCREITYDYSEIL